jgi:hypothetical protein
LYLLISTTTTYTTTYTTTTYTTLFLASIRTKHEMSRTGDSAARCPENDDQPTHGDQELEDQLTQEQFEDKLEKDLVVMLT